MSLIKRILQWEVRFERGPKSRIVFLALCIFAFSFLLGSLLNYMQKATLDQQKHLSERELEYLRMNQFVERFEQMEYARKTDESQ